MESNEESDADFEAEDLSEGSDMELENNRS